MRSFAVRKGEKKMHKEENNNSRKLETEEDKMQRAKQGSETRVEM